MDINEIQYVAGGVGFLATAFFAVRLIWKLQQDGEVIYVQRSANQEKTIDSMFGQMASLRDEVNEYRLEIEKCHKERLVLIGRVAQLELDVEQLKKG
jgi:hypothetical protein